jgi:hypothetical protein
VVEIVDTDDVDMEEPERDRLRLGTSSSTSLDRLRPRSAADCASCSSAIPFLEKVLAMPCHTIADQLYLTCVEDRSAHRCLV